ncbi:MAG: head GIN domain-containing protein [Saprospiraceae bacterium]
MKNLKWLAPFCFILLFTFSCENEDGHHGVFNCLKGEGNVITQELLINEFKSVKLKSSSNVFITQGSPFKVMVKGQANIISNIETDIQDGRWEIEFEDCMKDYTKLNIYITMPDIQNLKVDGSGSMQGVNEFDVDEIELKVDGSGEMDIELSDATKVIADISGSGEIKLAGAANVIDIEIGGSGDVYAFDLETNIAHAKINGSGDVEVFVNDELTGKINGSGDLYYKGNPYIDMDIHGSGKVKNSN